MKSSNITKKSDKEHLHLRKAFYIGNCSTIIDNRWVIDGDELEYHNISYNEGYFKLINEIIDNSIDEYIKTNGKYSNKIEVLIKDDGFINIIDNGRGVSSKKDKLTGKYQVQLAFCDLKSGSNWDRNASIGMNGIGSSAVNMFSESFIVETCDGVIKSKLVSLNNAEDITLTRVKCSTRGTSVEFKIDMSHFDNIKDLTIKDVFKMVKKRLYELKMAYPKINFSLNGDDIENVIWDFIKLDKKEFSKNGVHINCYYKDNISGADISYVNGLDTYKGGIHLKYIKNSILGVLKNIINKKFKVNLKNSNIYSKFIFGISIINFPKPEFNTQNKTELINTEKEIKEYLIQNKIKLDVISKDIFTEFENEFEELAESFKNKNIKNKLKKVNVDLKKVKRISQFIDAVDKNRRGTTLFIVEGDSAKSHFPLVRNKQKHGMFPLKGKVLNAFNATLNKMLENKELTDLMNIIGLRLGENKDSRYFDKIALLTDADVDGGHISSLLLLFFYKYFPHLIDQGRILQILSPIIICKKGKKIQRFYKYDDFLKEQEKYNGWSIEYNKGLGSLDVDEYSLMINNLKYEEFKISDMENTKKIVNVLFNKKTANIRKDWLNCDKKLKEIIND